MGLGRSSTFPRYLLSLCDIHALGAIKSTLPPENFKLQTPRRAWGGGIYF